jgi:uncharacterized protein with FMN-binding domain
LTEITMRPHQILLCISILLLLTGADCAEDLVELLSGAKVRGKVVEIRKEAREFDVETTVGSRTVTRTYSYDRVEAVTINGKRYVLNARTESASTSRDDSSERPVGSSDGSTTQCSRAEIERLIEKDGTTPPDWFESTELDYPSTLDLSWPLKPPTKDWQAHKYVFHYLWSNVNPNPSRWKSGVKLIHHILPRHRNDPTLLARDMLELGNMYFRLLQDYPRAAFWYRKSGVQKGTPASVWLAECYWQMGSKAMAMEELNSRTLPGSAIKLLSDMGETRKALQLVEAYARAGQPHEAYLLGGDTCRAADRLDDAVRYYQKVLASKGARNAEYERRFNARAKESIEAIQLLKQSDPRKVADGTYTATATAYAGPMDVKVQVAGGRIESVEITKYKDKQFFAALTSIPEQIIANQSIEGVDAVTRATVTSQAIVNATAKALASGAVE